MIWSSGRCTWSLQKMIVNCPFQHEPFHDSVICGQVTPRLVTQLPICGTVPGATGQRSDTRVQAFSDTQIVRQRELHPRICPFSRAVRNLFYKQFMYITSKCSISNKYQWVTRFSVSHKLTGRVFAWRMTNTMRREVDMRCVKTSMIIPTVLCCAMAVEGEMAFCCNITPFCDPSAPGRPL